MADRRIHIGVDGRELSDKPTGVGRYVREVLSVWGADREFQKKVKVTVFGTEGTIGTTGTEGTTIDWVIDERAGMSFGPKMVRYPMPTIASGMPSGASSNIVICLIPMSRRVPFTRMLVEVPIKVLQPPRIDA